MSELQRANLCYLASPYTKFRGGDIEAAFIEASKIAAKLLLAGIKIYSPIAHTHPIAVHGGLDPLDLSIWLPFDEAMMSAASVLIVARMDGWDTSKGVAHEIEFFETRGKPIYDLNPETMVMAKRQRLPPVRDRYENMTDAQIRDMTNSYLQPKPQMTAESAQARIAELDRQIAAAPHWGAAISAMDEERKELQSFLRQQPQLAHGKTPSEQGGSSV